MTVETIATAGDLDRLKFAVLDLLAEDEMDFFEVVSSAERAAPGATPDSLRDLAVDMWRDGLVTACAPDGPPVADPQAAIADLDHWTSAKIDQTTPRLCLTEKGHAAYRNWDARTS